MHSYQDYFLTYGLEYYLELVTILKELDPELAKGALCGEGVAKYFFDNCQDEAIAEAVRDILK